MLSNIDHLILFIDNFIVGLGLGLDVKKLALASASVSVWRFWQLLLSLSTFCRLHRAGDKKSTLTSTPV